MATLLVLCRFLHFIVVLLMFGAWVFRPWLLGAHVVQPTLDRQLLRITRGLAGLGLFTGVVWLLLITASMAGKPVLMEEFGGCTAAPRQPSYDWEWDALGQHAASVSDPLRDQQPVKIRRLGDQVEQVRTPLHRHLVVEHVGQAGAEHAPACRL